MIMNPVFNSMFNGVFKGVTGPAPVSAAPAVQFDGTNDYLLSDAALSVTDGNTGIMSFWIFGDAAPSSSKFIIAGNSLKYLVSVSDTNAIVLGLTNASNVTLVGLTSSSSLTGGVWNHVLLSWNTSGFGNIARCYINDAAAGSATPTTGTIDYTDGAMTVAGVAGGLVKYPFKLSQVYFAPNQILDLTVASNRRKFTTSSNKPIDFGSDGSVPTGVQPTVLFDGNATGFGTNKGDGGAFTTFGALVDFSPGPQ